MAESEGRAFLRYLFPFFDIRGLPFTEGTFGHTGFTGTSIVVVPSLKLSVILLINRQNMGLLPSGYYYNPNPLRKEIFEAVLADGK